ncbi:MAG: flagellar filament capping protein FliD [Polyangia bacterium]
MSVSSSSLSFQNSTAQELVSAAQSLLQQSGVGSSLDTSSIVSELIQADSAPLTNMEQEQSDDQTQLSTLGALVSQLQSLQSAATTLSTSGVVDIQPSSTYSDFTTSGSATTEGNYTIQVNQLATTAQMRSQAFASADDSSLIPAGTLQFAIDGKATASINTAGMSLNDIAQAINNNMGGLTASVIATANGNYLDVARSSTGYSSTPEAALTVVSDPGLGLITPATVQSQSYSSADNASLVPSGTLQFDIDGQATASINTSGKSLAQIAQAINSNISGLSASVVSTSNGYALSVTSPDAANLSVASDPGLDLALQPTVQNAELTVDGLPVSSPSNAIQNVIPGLTLQLTGASGTTNNVSLAADSSGSEAALQNFVTAYNTVIQTLNSQIDVSSSQADPGSLIDFGIATGIENQMQAMLSQVVVSGGSVQTLSDLGLEIQKDGTLDLNSTTLASAVQADPNAVNAVFSTATSGIAATVTNLVNEETASKSGALTVAQSSLNSNITNLTSQESNFQTYLDQEQEQLTDEYTNMETTVNGFNAAKSYLDEVNTLADASSSSS